ncbi:MAG: hypothetical protein JXA67_20300 [Micromonosporaceae bacterium]|nr:hypothetical protein [Micromonosporaceae bacterium]
MLFTKCRLIVTSESRLLRQRKLHLNVEINQLAEVAWTPDPEHGGIQLNATAMDGVREHLWIRLSTVDRVWKLDRLLCESFPARPSALTNVLAGLPPSTTRLLAA